MNGNIITGEEDAIWEDADVNKDNITKRESDKYTEEEGEKYIN